MGYNVHITRKDSWAEESGPEISMTEWRSLIAGEPDMRLEGHATAPLPEGGALVALDESLAVWMAYSRDDEHENKAWFWLADGNIVAKNPDKEILRKMWSLAQRLGARVQGDDGESYGAAGDAIIGT